MPGFRDVMTSCEEMGIGPAGLAREMRRSKQAFGRGGEFLLGGGSLGGGEMVLIRWNLVVCDS